MSPEGPALRVWLPFRRCQPLTPSEASFSSQRSWASLFRAFLLQDDPNKVSLIRPVLALRSNRATGLSRASTVSAHLESRVPLSAPRGFSPGRDPCSLELSDLWGAPSTPDRFKVSLLKSPLSSLSTPRPYNHGAAGPQGLSPERLGLLPP